WWRAFSYTNAFVRFAAIRGRIWHGAAFAAALLLSTGLLLQKAAAETGIAARYPGDINIGNDPAVIVADDFESYTDVSQLSTKWNRVGWPKWMKIATAPGTFYAGKKSLEITLPVSATEIAASLGKDQLGKDTVFMRMYEKWES